MRRKRGSEGGEDTRAQAMQTRGRVFFSPRLKVALVSSAFSLPYHLDRAARQAESHGPHRPLAGPVDERVHLRDDKLRSGGVGAVGGGGGDRAAMMEMARGSGDGGRRHGSRSRRRRRARQRRRGGPQRRGGGRREQRRGCPRGGSHLSRERERGRGRERKNAQVAIMSSLVVLCFFFLSQLFATLSLAALFSSLSFYTPQALDAVKCSWPRGGQRGPLPLRPRSRCRY